MERKAEYKLRLKTDLSEGRSEIGKLTVRTDKVAVESKQCHDELEKAIMSLLSGDEVWYFWLCS